MDKWIKVTDRLPEQGESVLICRKVQTGSIIDQHKGIVPQMGDWITNGIYNGFGWEYCGWPAYDVTYWMPLPAAPEVADGQTV